MIDRTGEIRSTRAPRLRTDQIEILKRYGHTRRTEVGDVLFRAGDTRNDLIVVLEGEVKVGDDFADELRTIGVFHESRFLGELNMLTGQAMYLTAVVSEAGEVLSIPSWPRSQDHCILGRWIDMRSAASNSFYGDDGESKGVCVWRTELRAFSMHLFTRFRGR